MLFRRLALWKIEEFISDRDYEILNISFTHLKTFYSLPKHRNDPFDRLLISQAITEDITFISIDKHFKAYPVKLLW
ncbi:MAG: type II toxin-antitoxin system VapC family toxin [Mucilaginibacter sp.]